MKKSIIVSFLALFLIVGGANAKTLYQFYKESSLNLPSIAERATTYKIISADKYRGTASQNQKLLDYLTGDIVGATIPQAVANFETSLSSKITSSDTSMTLVSGTTGDGTTLNGTFGFVIDSGNSQQEYVIATCVDTACTGMTRGGKLC